MPIERPLPVVDQVNALLRQRIRDQVYPPGSRLPSESELAQELGVSRATVRTVLAKLAAEGLILRKQGDGTFVNQRLHEINTSLGGMLDFSQLIASSGYTPSIETRAITWRSATLMEQGTFGVEEGTAVLSLSRLFFADGEPAILAQNVIPADLFTQQGESYDGNLPIHTFLRTYCGQEIAYAIYDIQATLPGAVVGKTLQKSASQPLLKLTVTFYSRENRPLAWGVSYYDDARLQLRLVQAWG